MYGVMTSANESVQKCATISKNGVNCPERAAYRINKDGTSFSFCKRCLLTYAQMENSNELPNARRY